MAGRDHRGKGGDESRTPAAAGRLRKQVQEVLAHEVEDHVDGPGLVRRRIAQAVAMAGVLAFIAVDYLSAAQLDLPGTSWSLQFDWKLIATVLPLLVLPVAFTVPRRRSHAFGQYLLMGMFVIALAMASAIDIGRDQKAWLNFESLMLVTIYIYFISGLAMFRAVFCGLCAWLAFTIAETSMPDGHIRMGEVYYLLTANVVGSVGLYYLERTARERFSDQYLLRVTAMLDSLTGVLNRGAIRSHIERTWRQACREDKTYAMLLLDVDRFKDINDQHGHPVGDACLAHVADVLAQLARRPLDAVGRWGGDEFVAVWYDIDARHFASMLKGIAESVALFKPAAVPNAAPMQPLAITGGAVLVLPGGEHKFTEVMEQADALLYKAKRTGRGQILTALSVDLDAKPQAA